MKFLKFSTLFLLLTVLISSCSKEEDKPGVVNEVENLQLVKSFTESGYTIELFNTSGQLQVGYNELFLRFKDQEGKYLNQSTIEWMPLMTMNMNGMMHEHSCPYSTVSKVSGKETLFKGYIVFIMASNEPGNYWDLKINFSADGQEFETHDNVSVIATESEYNKVYTSGMGSDNSMYFLALIEPSSPKIGTNDITVGLFKKVDNMSFPIVNNYTIKVDPRMPGMGNHSAPGNEDMIQGGDFLYHGKVGFSMSGYWKINLILEDESGTLIRGEAITDQTLESILNFKLEF